MSLVKLLLKPHQLAAIGLVAAESASLEGTIDLTLSILTKLADEECSVLFGGKTLRPKLDIVKELGLRRLRSQEAKAALTAIADLLSSLIGERNAVVHGTWQSKDGFTFAYIAQMTKPTEVEAVLKRRNGNVQKVNAKNLDELADRLSEAHSALFNFVMDHWIRPVVRRNARRAALLVVQPWRCGQPTPRIYRAKEWSQAHFRLRARLMRPLFNHYVHQTDLEIVSDWISHTFSRSRCCPSACRMCVANG